MKIMFAFVKKKKRVKQGLVFLSGNVNETSHNTRSKHQESSMKRVQSLTKRHRLPRAHTLNIFGRKFLQATWTEKRTSATSFFFVDLCSDAHDLFFQQKPATKKKTLVIFFIETPRRDISKVMFGKWTEKRRLHRGKIVRVKTTKTAPGIGVLVSVLDQLAFRSPLWTSPQLMHT